MYTLLPVSFLLFGLATAEENEAGLIFQSFAAV